MSQESIQDFVKIPGVLGVALIQGQAQLYFYAKEPLDERGKQFLTLNILQLIAKKNAGFENWSFQIMSYYACAYELSSDFIFLVLTDTDISAIKLRPLAARQLKATLQKDINKALTAFKLLSRTIAQPKVASTGENLESYSLRDNPKDLLELNITIEQLLKALNHLSQFSSNYIGPKLTANYWQLTRSDSDWLDNFRINRSAEMVFSGLVTEAVSSLQHQLIKEWTNAFIKHCSQIILHLPIMIEQKGLNEKEKKLLLTLDDN